MPTQSAGWGSFERVIEVVSRALKEGPFLLGEQFTAADVAIGSQLSWGVMIEKVPETPEIGRYLSQLEERPARKRTLKREEDRDWPR